MEKESSEADALLSKDGGDVESQVPPASSSPARRLSSRITPEVQHRASMILGSATTGVVGEMFVKSASRSLIASTDDVTATTDGGSTTASATNADTASEDESNKKMNFCFVLSIAVLLLLVATAALSFMGFLAVGCTSIYYGRPFTEESLFGFQIGALLSISLFVPLLVGVSLGFALYPCLLITAETSGGTFFCCRCFTFAWLGIAALIVFPGMFISMGMTLAHNYGEGVNDEEIFWSCIFAVCFHSMFGLMAHCICGKEIETENENITKSSGPWGRYIPSILAGSCVAHLYGYSMIAGAIVGFFGVTPAVIPILHQLQPY